MLLPRLVFIYAALVEAPPSMGGMCYWNAGIVGLMGMTALTGNDREMPFYGRRIEGALRRQAVSQQAPTCQQLQVIFYSHAKRFQRGHLAFLPVVQPLRWDESHCCPFACLKR
ncbi:hypothetical protein PC358_25105 [Pseudomonas capeferrum]|jgi:hypothetical protein|nr:hypothetical protein PC358_25105 [Pseudomonas capeferrum]